MYCPNGKYKSLVSPLEQIPAPPVSIVLLFHVSTPSHLSLPFSTTLLTGSTYNPTDRIYPVKCMVNIQAGKVSNLKNTMFYLFLVVLFFFLCGCCSVEQQIKLNIIGVWTRLCEIWKSYKPQKRKDSFKHLGHSTAVEYVRCVNLCMTGGEHERQLHVCSNCQLKAPLSMPFVVVSRSSILLLLLLVCVSSTITGQPQNSIFIRSIGLAETTSQDKPAFSFVRGQDSTM